MNLQLVLGNETYGVNAENTAISATENIKNLKAGSYLVLVDNQIATPSDIPEGERFQFIVGLVGTTNGMQHTITSVPIRRKSVLNVTRDKFHEDINGEWVITPNGLTNDSEGEAHLVLNNHSYNRTIQNAKLVVSANKSKGETPAAFMQRVVDKINAKAVKGFSTPFVEATLNETAITLEVKDANIDFTISRDGLFATATVENTVQAEPSTTRTSDLIASEKELSGNLGNGGYVSLTEQYFSMPLQTEASRDYDIFNIKFQGEHDTPTNRVRSAVMNLKIAIPTAKGDAFETFLNSLVGGEIPVVETEVGE